MKYLKTKSFSQSQGIACSRSAALYRDVLMGISKNRNAFVKTKRSVLEKRGFVQDVLMPRSTRRDVSGLQAVMNITSAHHNAGPAEIGGFRRSPC